jgi:hypothetical protein
MLTGDCRPFGTIHIEMASLSCDSAHVEEKGLLAVLALPLCPVSRTASISYDALAAALAA